LEELFIPASEADEEGLGRIASMLPHIRVSASRGHAPMRQVRLSGTLGIARAEHKESLGWALSRALAAVQHINVHPRAAECLSTSANLFVAGLKREYRDLHRQVTPVLPLYGAQWSLPDELVGRVVNGGALRLT
jgi:hypothetical protein